MHPLVSIIVITYKSSQYVIDTLNSVLEQSYDNIELIISDDCSPDDTYQICQDWINNLSEKNHNKFKRILLTQTSQNGGICANYNHALKLSNGEWIKYIAGDDILIKDSIEEYIKATRIDPHQIYLSDKFDFITDGKKIKLGYNHDHFLHGIRYLEKMISRDNVLPSGPTLFINKKTLQQLGGFDEKYPMVEDYPIIMKFLKNGYMVGHVPQPLVEYRIYADSVSHSNPIFVKSIHQAYDDYGLPSLLRNHQYLRWWHEKIGSLIRNKKISRPVGYFLTLTDILHIYNRLKSITIFGGHNK